jgi:hypothetical protein
MDFVREVVPGKAIFTVFGGVGRLYIAGFVVAYFCAGLFIFAACTFFLAAALAATNVTCLDRMSSADSFSGCLPFCTACTYVLARLAALVQGFYVCTSGGVLGPTVGGACVAATISFTSVDGAAAVGSEELDWGVGVGWWGGLLHTRAVVWVPSCCSCVGFCTGRVGGGYYYSAATFCSSL